MVEKSRHWYSIKPWSRHSLILTMAGLGYVFTGFTYIFAEQSQVREDVLVYAVSIMPFDFWGGVFILVGCIALLSSVWPISPKTFGYTVLTGWSAAWSSFYFVGTLATDVPFSYFSTGLVWGLVGFLWWAISGLVSPGETGDG